MYKYSQKSLDKLKTCHDDLQKIFMEAIKYVNITIIEGIRTVDRQQELFNAGKSKTMNSKHLGINGVSMAVDVALWPIDWSDRDRFVYLGGFIQAIAFMLHEKGEIAHLVRWGGDWDSDQDIKEHKFFDGPHCELYLP